MTTASDNLTRPCPHCGRQLKTLTAQLCGSLPPAVRALPIVCDCAASALAELKAVAEDTQRKFERELARRYATCGMPESYRERKFGAGCVPLPEMRESYAAAWQWCKDVINSSSSSPVLYIAGSVGTGKTWLASCCVNTLIESRWITWRRYGDLLRDIKDTYSDRSTRAERDVIDRFGRKTGILVIDDLGKDKPSEWAVSRLYDIIDDRYSHRRSTIITTNYGGSALIDRLTPRDGRGNVLDDVTPQAIVDRLREVSLPVKLTGTSLRTNEH